MKEVTQIIKQQTYKTNSFWKKSGPEDNVFVYFADHGAPGLVAFPNGDVVIIRV